MAEDIKQLLEEQEQRLNKHTDEKAEETKRHFDVVAERIEGKIDTLVEGFELHTQQMDRMEKHLEVLEPMRDDIEAMKTTFESVNPLGLKQEVVDAQKRVAVLESKENEI